MIIEVLHCPNCQGTDIVRHGQTRQGKQRYRCREQCCAGRTFLLDYAYPGQSPEVKRHPLEGSCQEAIPLLYTTFDIFFRCVPLGTLHPRLVISDASVFSLLWRRLPLRRTSHPSGSRLLDVSRSCQTSAPGTIRAPENPRFPAASNRVHLTDVMAPSRVQLFQGSRQRRR